MRREGPHFDQKQLGGTKALRNIAVMFSELRKYTPPRRRIHGWSRKITTAELAERETRL